MSTRTLTVVFTDIKGLSLGEDTETMLAVLNKHEELLLPVVEHYGGRVVKTLGEAFLLVFEGPTQAVLAGVMMQRRLRLYNQAQEASERIEIGVAIHTGEVEAVSEDGVVSDVYGDAVNVASHIEGVTDAGEVFFTESTYLAMNKAQVPSSEVGHFRLKGLRETIKVYKVLQDEDIDGYRELVQREQIPDTALKTPGAYSRSLLYALERGGAPRSVLVWQIATGLLAAALVVVSAVAFFPGYRLARQRSDVRALIEQERNTEALQSIARLLQVHPTDEQLQELAARAVSEQVRSLLAERRFDDATSFLEQVEKDFPYLPNLKEQWRVVRLEHALTLARNNPRGAVAELNELYESYPEDPEVKFALAIHSQEIRYLPTVERAVALLESLFVSDDLTDDQRALVLDRAREVLETQGSGTVSQPLVDFYAKYLFDDLEGFLRKSLLQRPPADAHPLSVEARSAANLRRNAYRILRARRALGDIETFRFFTVELLESQPRSEFFDEFTGPYFEELLEDGLSDEQKTAIPEKLQRAICISKQGDAWEKAREIVSAFFAMPLRSSLEAWAVGEDDGYRVNAFWILKQHGWVSPELEHAYHLQNLEQYDERYASPYVIDSVEYFGKLEPSQGKPGIPHLQRIVEGTAGEIEGLKESGVDPGPFQVLNRQARTALRHLQS